MEDKEIGKAKFGALGFGLIALACAVFAGFIVYSFITSSRLKEEKNVKVLVISANLNAGDEIKKEMIKQVERPESQVPVQAPFVQSLGPPARAEAAKANRNAPNKDVPLACVVCKLKLVDTDGLVPTRSQWPNDLQQCGVPVVHSSAHHFTVMQSAATAKAIDKPHGTHCAQYAHHNTARFGSDNAKRSARMRADRK